MYATIFARTRTARRGAIGNANSSTERSSQVPRENCFARNVKSTLEFTVAWALAVAFVTQGASAVAQVVDPGSVVRRISGLSEKLELTTNTSRILTLDKNIPRVQVNNPELLAVTPLSANQVQVSAKKAGVTQVNLWDEDGNIHTVDVLIYGDARELEVALQTQFPNSTIKVYRYSESLVLKGFVDRPDYVSQIMRLAEDYAPKVINNISVGGVQQVLLKVKVMEVSRTKLRRLGVDWAYVSGGGGFAINSINDMLSIDGGEVLLNNGLDTFAFGIVDGNDAFFGALDALQRAKVAKILAEPNIVAVSGRPAKFVSGGEFAYVVPQNGGGASTTFTAEFKEFGTIIDFLPIVLGNGKIRLEVRPVVSSRDFSLGTEIQGELVPGIRKRSVDTAVEMQAGQTFALAGLVEERVDTVNHGLPYVSDLPVIGVPFRKTEDEINEIELLILVTPEFVDPMECYQAPCGGPGYATTSPNNCQLYCAGHVEVPAQCNPIRGPLSCGEDGCTNSCGPGGACGCNGGGANGGATHPGAYAPVMMNGDEMSGGVGYDDQGQTPTMATPPNQPLPTGAVPATPADLTLPPVGQIDQGAQLMPPSPFRRSAMTGQRGPATPAAQSYSPTRQPVFQRNASRGNIPQNPPASANPTSTGLIGPVGYDAE